MSEARDLTERIRGWLSSGAVPASAASVAEAYAWRTRRAVERLSRCAGLLAQGLRSEAVQEAEAEPALLRELAGLELADAAAWGEVCRKQGWPVPELVRAEVVALLNRAYADESMVEPLLREYRLRCVVRAPIAARLAALRALAGVDRANRPWQDQLVALERARHVEIREEVQAAMGDVPTLQALRRELQDDRQKVTPSADLVRLVDAALQHGRVDQAQRRLEALLPSLETAYSAMDFEACRALLADWTQTLKAVGRSALQVPEGLRGRVEPVLQWVEAQEERRATDARFEMACERLAATVAEPASRAALEERWAEAGSFERPLPGTLGQDAREQLERARRLERRTRRLKLSVATAAAVVVVAGLGVSGWRYQRANDAERRLATIAMHLDERALDRADAAWSRFAEDHASRVDSAEARGLRDRLDRVRSAEAERAAAFAADAAALESVAVEGWSDSAVEALVRAARGDVETERAEAIASAWSTHVRAEAERANAEAIQQLAAMRASLNGLRPEALDAEPEALRAAAVATQEQSEALLGEPRLTASTRSLVEAVATRAGRWVHSADEVLAERRRVSAMRTAEANLVQWVGQPSALATALRDLVSDYPEVESAQDYARSAERVESWLAVEAWLDLRSAWASPWPVSRSDAAVRLQSIEKYRQAHPDSPWLPEVSAYAAHLGTGLLLSAEDGPWLGRLPALMRAPAFRDLNVAFTEDGERFYVVGDGNRRETSLGSALDVALSPDLSRLTPMSFEPGTLGPIGPSPQAALASELLSAVARFRFEAADGFVVDVLERVFAAQDVDSVLRGVLLGMVLDAYAAEVSSLDEEVQRLRKRLAMHVEDTANWMNPGDAAANRSRLALDAMFAEGLDFSGLRERIDSRRSELREGVSPMLLGRGLLMVDDGLRPRLAGTSGWNSEETGGVYGVSADGGAWVRIGRWAGAAGMQWERGAASVPAGSPVWWVAE